MRVPMHACCRIPEKGVPQAKTEKTKSTEHMWSRLKSPTRPRPSHRGPLAEAPSLRPPVLRFTRGSSPRPPRRGLRRYTDSPTRARPARHQPCDHRFDRTALAGHHIQSKHSTTPTDARRHSTAKWPTGRQSRQHPAICDGTEQGLPTTVLANSCTKDNATWGVRTGFL